MSGIVGIQSYAAVAGTTAATSALQGALVLYSQGTTALANAVAPPGSEGASMLSTLNNKANTNDFSRKFAMGVTEMQNRNGVVAENSAANAAADVAGATSVSAVNPVL